MAITQTTLISGMPEAELTAAINARNATAEDAVEAFKELRRRGDPAAAQIARTKVTAKSAPVALRTAAAVALGAEASSENEAALIKALDPTAPVLIKSVAQSLGRIGDKAALKKLEAMPVPETASDAKAISFAKSLISYRLRLSAHQIAPAAPSKRLAPEQASTETLAVTALKPASVDAVGADLLRHVPGIALTNTGALQFKCRNSHFMIVMTRAFEDAGDMADFGRQSGVLAVVFKQATCSDGSSYALYEYILGNAAEGKKMALIGVRASGETIHSGQVNLDDVGAFSLEAENSVHTTPLSLGGRFEKGAKKAALETILVSPTRAASQPQPKAVRPERITTADPPRAVA
jgi:hypothetical protein